MKTTVPAAILACLLTAACSPDKPQGPPDPASAPAAETIQYIPRIPLPAADGQPASVMTMGWIAPARPNGNLKIVSVTPSGDSYDTIVSEFAFACTGKAQYVPKQSVVYDEDGKEEQRSAERPPQDIDAPSLLVNLKDLACDGTKVPYPDATTEQIISRKDWGVKHARQFTAEAKGAK